MFRLVTVPCLIASLGGCGASPPSSCAAGFGSPAEIFTLFLGRSVPGRGELTDWEWQAFLDNTVTANLPDGYTVWDASGGWMNPITHKTIRESTKVLLVALPEAPDSLMAIERIRTTYQHEFQQQLVGMTVEHACADF
jgi:hypothetical protein